MAICLRGHRVPTCIPAVSTDERRRPDTAGLRHALVLIGVLVMSTAIGASTLEPIRIGERLPMLEGEFLTGRTARLPEASTDQVTLVMVGFTYASREPVEAWGAWYRAAFGSRSDMTFFEVPMIGGLAKLGRWFINRGMRGGTPDELHENVITVYNDSGDWKERLAYSPDHENAAYLVVLDREGIVRWLYRGPFDASRSDELRDVLAALADQPASSLAAGDGGERELDQ